MHVCAPHDSIAANASWVFVIRGECVAIVQQQKQQLLLLLLLLLLQNDQEGLTL
jgi:hypothetical protein